MMPKRIFGPRKEELTGCWKKINNLYSSENITMIKSRKTRWAGQVT
jgi:hypothetical protein